jgi:antitoxin component YwqK of YwqJK toxin-antitoxin module
MRSIDKINNKTDRKGRRQGLWEEYYTNGRLHYKGLYKNGFLVGVLEIYTPDGSLWYKMLCEDGFFN